MILPYKVCIPITNLLPYILITNIYNIKCYIIHWLLFVTRMTESSSYSSLLDSDESVTITSCSDDPNEESIRNFFPATRKGFKQVAGKIKRVTKKDFEDKHRLRHLECFKKSMDSWRGFDTKFDDYKNGDDQELWPIFSSVKNSNQNPKETTYISYETEFIIKNLNGINDKYSNSNSIDYYYKLNKFMYDLLEQFVSHSQVLPDELIKIVATLRKKYSISPSKHDLLQVFDKVSNNPPFSNDEKYLSSISNLRLMLRNKSVRSDSGVTVITVITSPGEFSCPADCHYCPNEPGQPRSYLSTEPAILRANQNDFDAILQFYDRAMTLYKNGHMIDKIEILILGGTWSGYPRKYQESFVRDLFYAANIFPEKLDGARKPLTISEEHEINMTSEHRIIGVTIETRPDRVNPFELYFLRNLGCTRVQIGIQHTDNKILEKVNRGHGVEEAIKAIYLLKENGFKVDIHLMPDLPYTTVEKDEEMFKRVLSDVSLQVDQWKIYPCEITPFTEIEKWYKDKLYTPYFETDPQLLMQLLQRVKMAVHPWIRLNRVIRDIPNPSIIAGTNITNMRQVLLNQMKNKGLKCKCIRCRECKDSGFKDSPRIVIRQYKSLGGLEYFISIESANMDKIFGFLRLRIRDCSVYNRQISHFKCLQNCALVRELHVYGTKVM